MPWVTTTLGGVARPSASLHGDAGRVKRPNSMYLMQTCAKQRALAGNSCPEYETAEDWTPHGRHTALPDGDEGDIAQKTSEWKQPGMANEDRGQAAERESEWGRPTTREPSLRSTQACTTRLLSEACTLPPCAKQRWLTLAVLSMRLQ